MNDFYESLFFEGDSPNDPTELGGKGGALFIPAHGLESDGGDLSVGGLRFIRLNFRQWDMIEKSWIRDVYGDFYRARPKWYCLFPFDAGPETSSAEVEVLTHTFLEEFRCFVLAARLVQPGVLVDVYRVVHVARFGAQNLRTVGPGRFRLYTTAFGESIVLPPKSRELGERTELLPPRVVHPIGPAYRVAKDTVAPIERALALYKSCLSGRADSAIGVVLRNFTVGHDIFLHQRQRLLCLLKALEACFGSFNRPGKKPVLGRRIAKAFDLLLGGAGEIESRIENDLRAVRNALAHGADDRQLLDFTAAEVLLGDVLRAGLPSLLGLILKLQKATGYASKTPGSSPMHVFQQLLDSADGGDLEAAQWLVQKEAVN